MSLSSVRRSLLLLYVFALTAGACGGTNNSADGPDLGEPAPSESATESRTDEATTSESNVDSAGSTTTTTVDPAAEILDETPVAISSPDPIPNGLPTVDAASNSANGVTFLGVPTNPNDNSGAAFMGVDPDGVVVWYLERAAQANQDPVVRNLGDGELLLFLDNELERVTLAGESLATYDLSNVPRWHHDAQVLATGGVLALGRETREVDGQTLSGDVIIELDSDGEVAWEWSAFDHLDTTRFPGELSLDEVRRAGGGIDWTHSNSIYLDASRNEILLSVRSQGWVVNIDRNTGDVVWIAGDNTGVDSSFSAPFLELTTGTWTTGQHAATWTNAGELLVYDNRNESGGETSNSRAVVYSIDEGAATATQVFEYVAPKYTGSLGDVDELGNGNILVTAGGPGSSSVAHLIEVSRSGETVWEATLDERVYRSERVPWADFGEVPGSTTSETIQTPSASGDPGNGAATDITGVVLTSTAASCSSYVGGYTSTVTDQSNGNSFTGNLVITEADDTCVLESNQIPNHDIAVDANFANDTGEVAGTFEIPATPTLAAAPTDLGFATHIVMLNGVMWEAYPAACFDVGPAQLGREAIGCGGNQLDHPWRYNVGSPDNVFRLDAYSAHSQASGLYHYHSTPEALYTIECSGEAESPVIGFARDGFPVFGPCFNDGTTIRAAESSFELKTGARRDIDGFTTPYVVGNVTSDEYNGQFIGDYEFVASSGDLDECNGMTIDGQYGYYATGEYPYVISCFSGSPSNEFGTQPSPR